MENVFSQKQLAHYQASLDALNLESLPQAQLIYPTHHYNSAKIGILDASFNPMTLAHEALVNITKDTHKLDEAILMLSGANVDKKIFGASLPQRLAMLVHYAKQQPHCSVVLCSHARFVDKIAALKTCYGPQIQCYFIVGFDTLIRIFDPKYYTDMPAELETLFDACHFVAANRGSDDRDIIEAYLQKKEVHPYAHRIHPISLPETMADISSTQVRDHIKTNQSIKSLVPEAILQAIEAQKLYTS